MIESAALRSWRAALLLLTVGLLLVTLYRGVAILASEPLLALANNYDMIRVQACIKAYPVRAPEIPPQAGNADAPIERYRFRDDVGAPCFRSSEVLFARLARPLFKSESLRSGDGSFSIRWLGLIKFSVFFALVAVFTHAWWRRGQRAAALANAAVAAVVLMDPAVTLYLNGFYAEFSTVLFGYASVAGAALLSGRERPAGIAALLLLGLTVLALVATKIQHIGLGLLLAATMTLPAVFGIKVSRRVLISVAIGGLAGLLFQAANLRKSDNDVMRLANKTSTVLTTLLLQSDDPYRTAERIGIPRRCGAYAGLNWYLPPVSENPANHPCREVVETSYLKLLGLAVTEPQVFARFAGRSLDYIRPWIPSTYRGVPHLGVVEGQRRSSLPSGWFTWSRILDRLPLWIIQTLIVAPAFVVTLLLVSRRLLQPAPAMVLSALAFLPYPVIATVIFGNGYEDAAKQMHLVFTMALGFWLMLALLGARLIGGPRTAASSPRGPVPVKRTAPQAPAQSQPGSFRQMNRPSDVRTSSLHMSWAASLAVLASAFFGYLLLASRAEPLPFDAEHFYFPMARRLMEEGFAYLLSTESVRSTPVSYFWPALFGIDPASIRFAHVLAGMALCLLAFDTARRLFSPWAGAIAAWALALSPLLRPHIAQPLTETPFLLFTAIWWWGLVAYLRGGRLFLIPTVIGGSLSILTRQIWFYPVLLLVISAAAVRMLRKGEMTSRIVIAHAIILVAPAMFMLKNHLIADHAVVATGAGSALYYGQHPFTGGFEPPLIGLAYDEGPVLSPLNVDHKSPLGDKVLTAIGLQWLRDRPILESVTEMPARIGRVLFLPNRGLAPGVFNNRALRIATICLALIALVAMWRDPMVVLLGAGLALQVMQLSLLLFNDRYTVGTLDYGLILLAGAGLALSIRPFFASGPGSSGTTPEPRWRRPARALVASSAVALLCTVSISIGYWVQRFMPLEEARMPRDPRLVRALGPDPSSLTWSANGTEIANGKETVVSSHDTLVRVTIPALHPDPNANAMWLIRMSIEPSPGDRCRRAELAFMNRRTQTIGPTRGLLLRDNGSVQDYVVGAHSATSVLFPREEGELHLRFACSVGTRIGLESVVLYQSRIPEIYGRRAEDIARKLR